MDIVFFYKACPRFESNSGEDEGLDLLETCRSEKKIFMPYVVWNYAVATRGFNDYLIDLQVPPRREGIGFWSDGPKKTGAFHTRATNLIAKVDGGTARRWAIIPRIGDGVCWIAEIPVGNTYSIWSNSSPWLPPLHSRLSARLPPGSEAYPVLADAAQVWDTGAWVAISFGALPRWFSKQLLAQSSFGEFNSVRDYAVTLTSPGDVAAQCHAAPTANTVLPNTSSEVVVVSRLVERLSPTALEFLCVELLALKKAHQCPLWMHVGGVGDGGVDGIGFDSTGTPAAFLTVKWQINSGTKIHAPKGGPIEVAYLVGTPPPPNINTTLYGPTDIARDILAYRQRISQSVRDLLGV